MKVFALFQGNWDHDHADFCGLWSNKAAMNEYVHTVSSGSQAEAHDSSYASPGEYIYHEEEVRETYP